MRRKIILSLFALFSCLTIGTVSAVLYISNNTSELKKIIRLHEVEQLRRSLLINIQNVSENLHTVNTPLAQDTDLIVQEVINLDRAAQKCSACHHPPKLKVRIGEVQSLIKEYEKALSYYITAGANHERIIKLKSEAASMGDRLIRLTKEMSHSASNSLEKLTRGSMIRMNHVSFILLATIAVIFLLGIIVAVVLTRSVTRPVQDLLNATKLISSGNYSHRVPAGKNDEIGALGSSFNLMTDALEKAISSRDMEIAHRQEVEKSLEYQAFYDQLTCLPNRSLFVNQLKRVLKRVKGKDDHQFAVLFADLDRFKIINDSLGHSTGDRLLVAVAQRLESCIRPSDTVSRFGGDEFAILINDIKNLNNVTHLADRILEELAMPFELEGHEVFISASIGIAMSTTGYDQEEDILRDADVAMYRAKSHGKARYEIFDTNMHASVMKILRLEADLRHAIERAEFHLLYQPIISLENGRITGSEALIRWYHPTHGIIPPMDFIPISEENGYILTIGEWVLRTACSQNKVWQDSGFPDLLIKVNFSVRQFRNQEIVKDIMKTLKETGLSPQYLDIEITESVATDNSCYPVLTAISDLGMKISIDDFGTGYSSLGALKHLPINNIKIDRSFIREMTTDSNDESIVRAIIAMAHNLNVQVIAEGVETEGQRAFLQARGCNEMQGYLYSRPVTAQQFTEILNRERMNVPACGMFKS